MKVGIDLKRQYGMTKTHLRLSAKAERYYSGEDPFRIYEIETDDGYLYTYSCFGDIETAPMTEAELNAELEAMADESEAVE